MTVYEIPTGRLPAEHGPEQEVRGAPRRSGWYETSGEIQFLLSVNNIFDLEPPVGLRHEGH